MSFVNNNTLCWSCKNAVPDIDGTKGCRWSRHFKPVDGWEAIPTTHKSCGQIINSYLVRKCPEYSKG